MHDCKQRKVDYKNDIEAMSRRIGMQRWAYMVRWKMRQSDLDVSSRLLKCLKETRQIEGILDPSKQP